jgi:hypothetical protein
MTGATTAPVPNTDSTAIPRRHVHCSTRVFALCGFGIVASPGYRKNRRRVALLCFGVPG